ncbi:hypothetical protein GCM10010275_34590 [Streptomyces litmocidini]|uniref:hypothetical protein n=1 Tax=Streptomyces litmocidini TaxID=67318 RepID=UPI00167CB689|nr:hypothetical protein [Streptomyces litmocidini]GGU94239.1 hypothetical protein GCM10010275_34590 [Streptomyces litmocidini]
MRHPFSATAARILPAAVPTASAAAAALAPAAAAEVLVDDFDLTRADTSTAPLEGRLPAGLLGTAAVPRHSAGRIVRTPASSPSNAAAPASPAADRRSRPRPAGGSMEVTGRTRREDAE